MAVLTPGTVIKPPRTFGFYAKRLALDLGVLYVVGCVGLCIFQKHIIYGPTTKASISAQDYGFAPSQAHTITTQTTDGIQLNGFHVPAPFQRGASTALSKAPLVDLYFYGNGGNRAFHIDRFLELATQGASVVCFDYRGYGDSAGSPSEDGLAEDARAAWQYLRSQNVAPGCIVVHGLSLGSAVAVRLTAELCAAGTPPAGLILEAPFTSLPDAGSSLYPFLPVGLLLRERYPSLERIPAVSCPLLILHGNRDQTVPIALGRKLFAAARAQSDSGIPKQFVELSGAGHNNLASVDPVSYDAAIAQFYRTIAPALAVEPARAPPKARRGRAAAK